MLDFPPLFGLLFRGSTVPRKVSIVHLKTRFLTHPAYQMVHNRVFYCVEMIVAILLMSLAFLEEPSVLPKPLDPYIHGILELIFLGIISLESIMKVRWMGLKFFVRHKRSMLKVSSNVSSSHLSLFIEKNPSGATA